MGVGKRVRERPRWLSEEREGKDEITVRRRRVSC